jgi:restriction system protein
MDYDHDRVDDASYREELLDIILNMHFSGFERLCQRLLREAGFQQVSVTGRSGDNGIDGSYSKRRWRPF